MRKIIIIALLSAFTAAASASPASDALEQIVDGAVGGFGAPRLLYKQALESAGFECDVDGPQVTCAFDNVSSAGFFKPGVGLYRQITAYDVPTATCDKLLGASFVEVYGAPDFVENGFQVWEHANSKALLAFKLEGCAIIVDQK